MEELILDHKQIHDRVHGFIKISNLASLIIDSCEFQRLRYLHQLGTCHYVFPSATHTRFEHSLGTYYLAGRLLESLKKNSSLFEINKGIDEIEELKEYASNKINKLDKYIIELIKIAALCHDLGHGPFSHVFDDIFIPSIKRKYNIIENNDWELHENRSGLLVEYIIQKNEILSKFIKKNQINFIKQLINPPKNSINYLFQIVSNNFNEIDVDKFDYLARDTLIIGLKYGFEYNRLIDDACVIDNIICFPEQMCYEVANIFSTRYRLHKQIYCHKTVISIQYMINEIMMLLDPILHIYNCFLSNIKSFHNLSEDYILSSIKILYDNKENYDDNLKLNIYKAYDIYQRINNRQLYKLVSRFHLDHKINQEKSDALALYSTEENIIMHYCNIGFVSGNKTNPLDNLFFFRKKEGNIIISKIRKEEISLLLPNKYQEHIYMFFTIDNIDKNYQLDSFF
ncbi:HD domain-containing protein [uncultured virus]|nr:HD domain-containing protein [uncultured virus]